MERRYSGSQQVGSSRTPEGGRVAEEGAEVLVVVDGLDDEEGPLAPGQLRGCGVTGPPAQGQHAAMDVETGDAVEDRRRGGVDRGAEGKGRLDDIGEAGRLLGFDE